MIQFRKILDAPATWKSEPIFAQPRYLIQAVAGEYRLFYYDIGERAYAFLATFALCQEAQSSAERHHHSLHSTAAMADRLVTEAIAL
jgi:hypothetical protein